MNQLGGGRNTMETPQLRGTVARRASCRSRALHLAVGAGVEALESRVLMAANDPYISEFVANNNTGLLDDSSPTPVRSDWIEIAHPGTVAVNLAGWHLTDSKGQPSKWTFPSGNATATTVPAGGYLVVFADN